MCMYIYLTGRAATYMIGNNRHPDRTFVSGYINVYRYVCMLISLAPMHPFHLLILVLPLLVVMTIYIHIHVYLWIYMDMYSCIFYVFILSLFAFPLLEFFHTRLAHFISAHCRFIFLLLFIFALRIFMYVCIYI